jgi:hypothetical protein
MWWKSKFVLFSVCSQLIFLALFSFSAGVKAEKNTPDGFVIEADRVVGSGLFVSVIKQETSTNDGKPMLRFQYKSATIYGMRLTKQVNSPKGAVSISLKAKGPVTVKGMTVDTTAISFKGACIKASETIPELGMDNVVMVAHYMNTEESDIDRLSLATISGNAEPAVPGKLKILQDLSMVPLNQLDKEIEKISSGHLPLTCADGAKDGKSSGIGKITDPLKDMVGGVTNPLEPILNPLDPVLQPLEPVLNPLDPVLKPLDPVLKPLEPVLKPLEPVIKPLEPVLKPLKPVLKPVEPVLKPLKPVLKPLDPVLKPVEPILKPLDPITKPIDSLQDPAGGATGTVEQHLQSACDQIKDAKGIITKELALDLIDDAIKKKLTLTTVCQSDSAVTTELKQWENSLLKSLGLLNIFGKLIPIDPEQELYNIRDTIAKKDNGAIVFKP